MRTNLDATRHDRRVNNGWLAIDLAGESVVVLFNAGRDLSFFCISSNVLKKRKEALTLTSSGHYYPWEDQAPAYVFIERAQCIADLAFHPRGRQETHAGGGP